MENAIANAYYKNYATSEWFIQEVSIHMKSNQKDYRSIILVLLKNVVILQDTQYVKFLVETFIKYSDTDMELFLRPFVKAIKIIENADSFLYYRELQQEERLVVAEIVEKLTGSNDLVPMELRKYA